MISSFTSALRSGFYYSTQGWELVLQPRTRRFVILSLLVSILLVGGTFQRLFTQLDVWISALMSYAPDWLRWLSYLLWPLTVISVPLVSGYSFSTIANRTVAPFSGLLTGQLEARLIGATPPDTGILGIMKDVPRIMKREWQRFAWYLSRTVILPILYFIPGIGQTATSVLWFLFNVWMLAIQYCDYPFDNHKMSFKEMRTTLRARETTSMQLGALTSLFTMIPLFNLLTMPVTVCGVTAMQADCYHNKHIMWR